MEVLMEVLFFCTGVVTGSATTLAIFNPTVDRAIFAGGMWVALVGIYLWDMGSLS